MYIQESKLNLTITFLQRSFQNQDFQLDSDVLTTYAFRNTDYKLDSNVITTFLYGIKNFHLTVTFLEGCVLCQHDKENFLHEDRHFAFPVRIFLLVDTPIFRGFPQDCT